jgi:hypothetical protein
MRDEKAEEEAREAKHAGEVSKKWG